VREVVAERDGEVLGLEVMPDHLHLLVEVAPAVALSRLVKLLKGRGSRRLRQEFPRRRRLPALWSPSWFELHRWWRAAGGGEARCREAEAGGLSGGAPLPPVSRTGSDRNLAAALRGCAVRVDPRAGAAEPASARTAAGVCRAVPAARGGAQRHVAEGGLQLGAAAAAQGFRQGRGETGGPGATAARGGGAEVSPQGLRRTDQHPSRPRARPDRDRGPTRPSHAPLRRRYSRAARHERGTEARAEPSDQPPGMVAAETPQVENKAATCGVPVLAIDPKHTSQTCDRRGTVDPGSRESQAHFHCRHCRHQAHTDINATNNILAAELAVTARGGTPHQRPYETRTTPAAASAHHQLIRNPGIPRASAARRKST
jgi:Putative transposase DNA-binding domain/Transposase IS200 like